MKKRIFISAGEHSGDLLGRDLIIEMQKKSSMLFEFRGIGGPKMESVGITSIFPMSDLSVIGFSEVIPKIFTILRRIKETIRAVIEHNPDIIITIDSPGFHFRLVKKLRALRVKTPIIHYVAPTVWAYSPKRAKTVAELYDHILLLLPFEKKYFDAVGIPSTFVGHWAAESERKFRQNDGKASKDKVQITIMLGSRIGEIQKHLAVLTGSIIKLSELYADNITIVLPTLPEFQNMLQGYFDKISDQLNKTKIIITSSDREKSAFLESSDLAIVKSGTSVMELACLSIPMIVIYKVSKLTAWFLRRKLMIKYVALCNIVTNEQIVPELLQEDLTTENILFEINKLLNDESARQKQIEGYARVKKLLRAKEGFKSSEIAADAVLSLKS